MQQGYAPEGDGLVVGRQVRFAGGIKASQDLHPGHLRDEGFDIIVQFDMAALDNLHQTCNGDNFGQGREP